MFCSNIQLIIFHQLAISCSWNEINESYFSRTWVSYWPTNGYLTDLNNILQGQICVMINPYRRLVLIIVPTKTNFRSNLTIFKIWILELWSRSNWRLPHQKDFFSYQSSTVLALINSCHCHSLIQFTR